MTSADGFFYDDLEPGFRFESPPAVTMDAGVTWAYQAIAGNSLALTSNTKLCTAVTGSSQQVIDPALLMHMSIGASTVATRNVIANLYYQNVVFHRPVFQGETLATTTTVESMADARRKPGVGPRGKVLLGIRTEGEEGVVLDYQRCALLPCRGTKLPGHVGTMGGIEMTASDFVEAVPLNWTIDSLGQPDAWSVGELRVDPLRDVVDGATALVRMTNNLAAVHRDEHRSPYGSRLVYGGHTVALAQASLGRMVSGLATILGWVECSHTAAVFEGDTLGFTHELVAVEAVTGGRILFVETTADAQTGDQAERTVLRWSSAVYTT